MEDETAQFQVSINDSVSNLIDRLLMHNHQIANMEVRLHAIPNHDDVGCHASSLCRGKSKPGDDHHHDPECGENISGEFFINCHISRITHLLKKRPASPSGYLQVFCLLVQDITLCILLGGNNAEFVSRCDSPLR